MSLNFITGAPGSGKTAVTNEIAARGFNIYDTDDPNHTGIAGWHNLETGEYVAGFNELELSEELLTTHIWKLTDEALDEFQMRSKTALIYLCGRLRDAQSVVSISRHTLFLTVADQTIEKRLAKRAQIPDEVAWGREPWQVERSIAVNRQIEEEYRKIGAIMIDANQPLADVVDRIIDATAEI